MIPRVIHQFWVGGEPPALLWRCRDSIRQMHPSWAHRFYDDDAALLDDPLVRAEFGDLRPRYAWLRRCVPESRDPANELLKMLAVWREGGFFLDLDCYAVRPLDRFLNDEIVFVRAKPQGALVSEAVIGAPLRSERIAGIIRYFTDRRNLDPSGRYAVVQFAMHCAKNDWPVYPCETFVPHWHHEPDRRYHHTADTHTIHLWHRYIDYDFNVLADIARSAAGEAQLTTGGLAK